MEIRKINTMGRVEYFATEHGDILSKHKHTPRKPSTKKRIVIDGDTYSYLTPYARGKEHNTDNHYVAVDLNGRGTVNVHRLVAESFFGDIGDNVVNHKNGIKFDNSIENLEIITSKQNLEHAMSTGLRKVVDYDKLALGITTTTLTQREIAIKCGCSVSTVEKYKSKNKLNRPKGYKGVRNEFS